MVPPLQHGMSKKKCILSDTDISSAISPVLQGDDLPGLIPSGQYIQEPNKDIENGQET